MPSKKEKLKVSIKTNKEIMMLSKKLLVSFMSSAIKNEVPPLTDAAFRTECRIFLKSYQSVLKNKERLNEY